MRAVLPERLQGVGGPRAAVRDVRPAGLRRAQPSRAEPARACAITRVNRLRQEVTTAGAQLNSADCRRWRRTDNAVASLTRTHHHVTCALGRGEATLHEIERELRTATDILLRVVSVVHDGVVDVQQSQLELRVRRSIRSTARSRPLRSSPALHTRSAARSDRPTRPQSTGSLPMIRRTCCHQLDKRTGRDSYQSADADDWGRPLIRTDEFVGERSADAEQTCSLLHVQDGRQCGTLDTASRVAVLRPAPRLRSARHLADVGRGSRVR